VYCQDWKETIKLAKPGDLIYIDPPYPESLGYGNNWWSFSDQLDIIEWINNNNNGINLIISNMWSLERLYRWAGFKTIVIEGPKSSRTRTKRDEVVAWNF